MNIVLIELLGLAIFAHILQANYKIPSPLTLIASVLIIKFVGYDFFKIDSHSFDNLVLVCLPLLIAGDALKLHWSDIRQHAFSLFWVAVVVVVLSIFTGALLNKYILFDHQLSFAAITLLFCMLCATDPVTVSAVFSNFKIPHELKVITEGESLFNDATALIIFSFALLALSSPTSSVALSDIALKSLSVIGGAIFIGLLCGYLCVFCLKLSSVALVEASFLLFFSYVSYSWAEHYHFSGILAIIICLLLANKKIQDILTLDESNLDAAKSRVSTFTFLDNAITSRANHQAIITSIDFVSMIAATALFVSVAVIVDFHQVRLYWREILALFAATTIIRAVMMTKFALLSHQVGFMHNIKTHWLGVLTFSGSKGALSVLMVHMIPNHFMHKKMFETIVIGNIVLSTVVYALILYLIMVFHKTRFEQEMQQENASTP